MTASPTPVELKALQVANVAVRNSSSPNSYIVDTVIFALGAVGMLQSPEIVASRPSPWQQAVDGLNALVDADIPFHVEPDGHISGPFGDEHIEWDHDAARWRLVHDETDETVPVDKGAADFYRPGRTYVNRQFPQYLWRFRCDAVTTHPEDGERAALGWRLFNGQWEVWEFTESDWRADANAVVVEESVAHGQAPAEGSAVCPKCGHEPGKHRPGGCIADAFRTGLIGLCGCMAEDTSDTKGGA